MSAAKRQESGVRDRSEEDEAVKPRQLGDEAGTNSGAWTSAPKRDKVLRRAGAWAWCAAHGDYYSGYRRCPKCKAADDA